MVVAILVGLMVVSAYSLAFELPSKTLDLAFGYPQRAVWSAQLLGATIVTLAGLYWRDPLTGLLIERVGWGMVVAGSVTYLVILSSVSTFSSAGIVVSMLSGVIVGALVRIFHIVHDLRDVRNATVMIPDA